MKTTYVMKDKRKMLSEQEKNFEVATQIFKDAMELLKAKRAIRKGKTFYYDLRIFFMPETQYISDIEIKLRNRNNRGKK